MTQCADFADFNEALNNLGTGTPNFKAMVLMHEVQHNVLLLAAVGVRTRSQPHAQRRRALGRVCESHLIECGAGQPGGCERPQACCNDTGRPPVNSPVTAWRTHRSLTSRRCPDVHVIRRCVAFPLQRISFVYLCYSTGITGIAEGTTPA